MGQDLWFSSWHRSCEPDSKIRACLWPGNRELKLRFSMLAPAPLPKSMGLFQHAMPSWWRGDSALWCPILKDGICYRSLRCRRYRLKNLLEIRRTCRGVTRELLTVIVSQHRPWEVAYFWSTIVNVSKGLFWDRKKKTRKLQPVQTNAQTSSVTAYLKLNYE